MQLPSEFDGIPLPAGRPRAWRLWLGAGVFFVGLAALVVWLALPLLGVNSARTKALLRRDDGVVVEYSPFYEMKPPLGTPRAGVTTVPRALLSYPYAYPPGNSGSGSCKDPIFAIEEMPPYGHVYDDGESLTVPIHYNASGCSQAVVAYLGRHVEGSRRYEFQCDAGIVDDCDKLRSWFFTDPVQLTTPQGILRLPAIAGDSASMTADSVPNLDGFVLCAITVSVGDLAESGNHSSQTIRLGCPYDDPP